MNLGDSQALFVHFSGYNLSFQPSETLDILDPLNLVWTDSIQAPFLSLDLGFNVYSFTTLSRVVHHTTVKVDVEPLNCLQNTNHSCITAHLARAYLSNVTKRRGVLCYAVNNSNAVNYRCCKGNPHTQHVECDISALLSPEMAVIFETIASAGLFAILCFPAILYIIPDEDNSKTLSANTQVHNPIYRLTIYFVQKLQHYSSKYYLDVLRKLAIGFIASMLYCIDLGLIGHTITYDIPKMFNDHVKECWVTSTTKNWLLISGFIRIQTFCSLLWISISVFLWFLFFFSLFPWPRIENRMLSYESSRNFVQSIIDLDQKEKRLKVDWLTPWNLFKQYLTTIMKQFKHVDSLCSKFRILPIVLILLSPVVAVMIIIGYTCHVSPLGRVIRPISYRIHFVLSGFLKKKHVLVFYFCFYIIIIPYGIINAVYFGLVFYKSLLLSARFIVYLWLGLVASKDYYFPRIAFYSPFVYYSWHCLSSVTGRYRVLLKQTYEKCKEHQGTEPDGDGLTPVNARDSPTLEEHQGTEPDGDGLTPVNARDPTLEQHQGTEPNARKALTFDDKGVPRISSELFEIVIDEIMPRSEVYTIMLLKLTAIVIFLLLTFYSILIYGNANLNKSTQALAVVVTALVPKLVEIFDEGSSSRQLSEIENACRVEKIVKKFLSQERTFTGRDRHVSNDEEQSLSDDHPSEESFSLEEHRGLLIALRRA